MNNAILSVLLLVGFLALLEIALHLLNHTHQSLWTAASTTLPSVSERLVANSSVGFDLGDTAGSDVHLPLPQKRTDRGGLVIDNASANKREGPPVPIVLVGINYQIFRHVPRATVPFMCARGNRRIVVLTNVDQQGAPNASKAPCLTIERVAAADLSPPDFVWPRGAPKHQRVFFLRWFLIRAWLRRNPGIDRVFTMDSDAIMTQDVTYLTREHNLTIAGHEIWLVYMPPRASFPFFLITRHALEDVTAFFSRLLKPDIWPTALMGGTQPNDMTAMGHYTHAHVGQPYPCWGVRGIEKMHCENDTVGSGYGIPKVLRAINRSRYSRGGPLRARYSTGTLSIDDRLALPFGDRVGVVDNNYRHDPLNVFEMTPHKQLRFVGGQAQLLLRKGRWVNVWGYILEDETEACVHHHLAHITQNRTCRCKNWCCSRCENFDTGRRCPSGRVYVYGLSDARYRAECFQTYMADGVAWNVNHSESHHSFNAYLWEALRDLPVNMSCRTDSPAEAEWLLVVQDFHSEQCRGQLHRMLIGSPEWAKRPSRHAIFVWSGLRSTPAWGAGTAVHSADDSLTTPVRATTQDSLLGRSAEWWVGWGKKGVTSPYWFTAAPGQPVVPLGRNRTLLAVGAWSNTRGGGQGAQDAHSLGARPYSAPARCMDRHDRERQGPPMGC